MDKRDKLVRLSGGQVLNRQPHLQRYQNKAALVHRAGTGGQALPTAVDSSQEP